MEPGPAFVPSGHDVAAAWHYLLGHGGLAYGLERERGRIQRSGPAPSCFANQSAARVFYLGRDFLERGIQNNPESPKLYEALARLYRDKYKDHAHAFEYFEKTAQKPGAPSYAKRFAIYELSYCEGREQEAYDRLRQLYTAGENERLPTLINRLKFLEEKINIPADQRIVEDVK